MGHSLRKTETREPIIPGCLYVLATPIGNLSDFSPRAQEILNTVPVIACEDTRTSRKLISTPLISQQWISFYENNEQWRLPLLMQKLQDKLSIALLSDAGTPGISDPGFRLVRECHRKKTPVFSIPGPCAAIAALAGSGLPPSRFLFTGFLNRRAGDRKKFFQQHLQQDYTLILYESPLRIPALLTELSAYLPLEHYLCIAREISKQFEHFYTETLTKLKNNPPWGDSLKGECVVLIAPKGFML